MEKEKEKKMQKVSKLTPEKRKVPCIAIYWQEHFNFFFWSGIRRGWTRYGKVGKVHVETLKTNET